MDKTGSFSPPGLYPDEAMNGNNISEAMDNGSLKIFYPENFGREGLFINIQGLSVKAFGHTPWALRLPSAIFGILTVLGIYFLVRQLFLSENLALFSAFLMATSFWHINFSRMGFRAIMAPALLVWGVYFFLKTLEPRENDIAVQNQAGQSGWLPLVRPWLVPVFGGIVYGLGFHSYIAYRATPLLMIGIAWLISHKYRSENRIFPRREFLVFTLAAILTALPIGIYFLQHPADFFGRTTGISIFNSPTPFRDLAVNIGKTLGMFNFAGDFNWRHNFSGRPELSLPVGIFLLIGLWFAFKKIISEKLSAIPELVLLGWFIIVMLPVVISDEGLPHALRAILMIPPVLILAGIGGEAVYDFLRAHVDPDFLKASLGIFFLLLTAEVYITYFLVWSRKTEVQDAFSYRDYVIGESLATLPDQLKKYVVVGGTQGTIRRDYPISLQTILFLTDTFTDKKRANKKFFYLTPEQYQNLPKDHGGIVINF